MEGDNGGGLRTRTSVARLRRCDVGVQVVKVVDRVVVLRDFQLAVAAAVVLPLIQEVPSCGQVQRGTVYQRCSLIRSLARLLVRSLVRAFISE